MSRALSGGRLELQRAAPQEQTQKNGATTPSLTAAAKTSLPISPSSATGPGL
jgi:hypothetical protein